MERSRRLASKKAQAMLDKLLAATRLQIKSVGNADWQWENRADSEAERPATLRDMRRLLESKIRHWETDRRFMPPEKAELAAQSYAIALKFVDRRIASWKS